MSLIPTTELTRLPAHLKVVQHAHQLEGAHHVSTGLHCFAGREGLDRALMTKEV